MPALYAMDLATGSFRVIANPAGPFGNLRTAGGIWAGGGFLYCSDKAGSETLRFNIATGEMQSLFGANRSRDWIDGTASEARLRDPAGIWGDGTRLYIADRGTTSFLLPIWTHLG